MNEMIDKTEREAKLERLCKACANELCYKCGAYRLEHLGACNGCRWLALRHGNFTEVDKHE